jgi:type IX secretion system PorP/SprF family membrane protein
LADKVESVCRCVLNKETYQVMKNRILKTWLVILALGTICSHTMYAQTEEQSSMYMFNPLLFNPAYAGSRGTIHAVGIARFQWVGIEGAPMSQFVSFDAPVANQNLGLGIHASNDKIGARSRTSLFGDISYSLKLNKRGHRLSFGMSAGVDWQVYDFNKLYTNDAGDPIYNYYASKVRPNFGAGVYYFGERFYAGVSVPRMLRNRLRDNNIGDALQRRHFYVTGGYVFKLSSVVDFKPSALVKISENAPVTFDINANFLLFKTLWIGPSYRFHESAGANVAIQIKEFMSFGYAFDFPINGLSMMNTNQKGTHEIMISFDLKTKKKPYISPRYF